MHRPIASALAFSGTVAAATLAAGLSLLPGPARADDITIDPTPFVSTRSRAEVRTEVLQNAARVRAGASEWALQQGEPLQLAGGLSRDQVRADYIAQREAVQAMNGEDSGSAALARTAQVPSGTRMAVNRMR